MQLFCKIVLLVFHLSCSDGSSDTENNFQSRAGKFLNFFQIVTFKNQPCATQDGSEESAGVCYSAWECSERGGQEMGNCASGFGRCCVIKNTDDKAVCDEPICYFQNTNFPSENSPSGDTKTYTVKVTDKNICQVRIDFENFGVSSQDLTGECSAQFLSIEGVGNTFCNTNTGQHVYLGIDSVPSNRDVDFTALRGSSYKYSLKVTQINCNTDDETMKDLRAPRGCLQYFAESGGTIQSFNYDGVNAYSINQDYSICIARSAKNCGIKYTNPPVDGSKARSVGAATQNGCRAGSTSSGSPDSGCGEDCLKVSGSTAATDSDWLTIAGGQLADADLADASSYKAFFCGQGLGEDTNSTANGVNGDGVLDFSNGPFIVRFHADSVKPEETAGKITDDIGFVIDYAVQTGKC